MKKIFYILVILGILANTGYLKRAFIGEPEFVKSYGDSVVLYSTSWCGYCTKTRQLLEKHSVKYIEVDIERSKDGKKEYDALSGRGVPLMIIGGEIIRGYDPKAILKLIQ